jgi:hypothetical protein
VPIDPSKTAVVLIEYQNDFTSEGGPALCRRDRHGEDGHVRQDGPPRSCGTRRRRRRLDGLREGYAEEFTAGPAGERETVDASRGS